jgi:O-antigen ligase
MLRASPLAQHPGFGSGAVRLARRSLYHLLSFELIFALYFYSNRLKFLLPPLPIDETVLFAALSFPIGLFIIVREGIYLRGLPIVAATLLLFTWAALSWGWSPSRKLATLTLSYIFTFSLWCVIAGALIIAPSRERTLRFLAFLLALSLFIACYGLYIYLTYGTFRFFRGFAEADFSRMYLQWGYAASTGAIIAFALLVLSRAFSLRQLLAAGMLGISVAFLLIASGRGPLLSAVFGILVALAAGLPRFEKGGITIPRWQVIGLGVVLVGAAYIAYLIETGTAFATFHRFVVLIEEAQNPDIIQGANRFEYYSKAVEFWLRSPIVGNGIASFSLLDLGFERPGTHPHNIFLQMLSDLGLVGLALLLWALWTGLRMVTAERLRHDGLMLCAAMLFAGAMFAAMISVDFKSEQQLFLYVGLLGLRPLPAFPHGRPAGARLGRPRARAGGEPRALLGRGR